MPNACAATPAKARLFLALWPDPAVRLALADWAGGWAWPVGAKVVAPERWHLTLHFIGPVPEARLTEVAQGLQVPVEPFNLRFGAVARWSGGLVVLAPQAVPEALGQLHERLAAALRQLGLPVEARPPRPHITLARKAATAVPPSRAAAFDWPARGYALVQSQGGYRTLARYG
jgi:2'-5' RNA ligase